MALLLKWSFLKPGDPGLIPAIVNLLNTYLQFNCSKDENKEKEAWNDPF